MDVLRSKRFGCQNLKTASLELLNCPYCGSNLSIKHTIEQEYEKIIAGSVKCDCSEYPILEGILILKDYALNEQVIELLEVGKKEEAIIRYLGSDSFEALNTFEKSISLPHPFPQKISHILGQSTSRLAKLMIEPRYKRLFKIYSDETLSFYDSMGNDRYSTYFKQRFSSESLWSVYPFVPLLIKKKERILDLSCGAGHASFILDKYVKPKEHFATDYSFRNLFLAKKFFAPNAEFICIDANQALPFKEGTFSSILMLDAFHCIRSRASLAREMKRTLCNSGLLLVLHNHNPLTYNLGGEFSVPTRNLYEVFADRSLIVKIVPENKILNDFLFRDVINLGKKFDAKQLDHSNATILVATSDESIFTKHYVLDHFLSAENNLIINPIYEIEKKKI